MGLWYKFHICTFIWTNISEIEPEKSLQWKQFLLKMVKNLVKMYLNWTRSTYNIKKNIKNLIDITMAHLNYFEYKCLLNQLKLIPKYSNKPSWSGEKQNQFLINKFLRSQNDLNFDQKSSQKHKLVITRNEISIRNKKIIQPNNQIFETWQLLETNK